MTKIAGSGSISQRHGSTDLDSDPLMDPQHWLVQYVFTQLTFLRKKNGNGDFSDFGQPTRTALHHFKLHGARIMKTPAWEAWSTM
jgi:hypothetical protein